MGTSWCEDKCEERPVLHKQSAQRRARAPTASISGRLGLQSAWAAAWHTPAPCLPASPTGSTLAVRTAHLRRGCGPPFCTKIEVDARASPRTAPGAGEPPEAAQGDPRHPHCVSCRPGRHGSSRGHMPGAARSRPAHIQEPGGHRWVSTMTRARRGARRT